MSKKIEPAFLNSIHESWIPYLRDLHWSGNFDAFLGKGYATFKLNEEEKTKWNLSSKDETRINEILQSNIDKKNSVVKMNDFMKYLSTVEYLRIPNTLKSNKLLIDELKKETPENLKKLKLEISGFLDPLKESDFKKLAKLYNSWPGRHIQTTLLKGASLIADFLRESDIYLNFPSIKSFDEIVIDVQPFMLLIYYYIDKKPEITRLTLFRELLLRKNENLTYAIDRILYSSWREFSESMYNLTQSWINSLNPILIDWLVHGVEVPGRKTPLKAFNFIKSAFYLTDENVSWIISHVTTSIICADPYQSLNIISNWLDEKKAEKIKDKIIVSLNDIITDKFEKRNIDQFDFPDLFNVLSKIMKTWTADENKLKREIASEYLNRFSELEIIA